MFEITNDLILLSLEVFCAFEFGVESTLLHGPFAHNALEPLDLILMETILLQQNIILSLHFDN